MLSFNTFLLLFGDDAKLQAQALDNIKERLPEHAQRSVRVWCNAVCAPTLERLRSEPFTVFESEVNVPKYILMRSFFDRGIDQPWILWLDDDTRLDDGWWGTTEAYIQSKAKDNVCFVGPCWFTHDIMGRTEFIKAAPWYRGLPWDMAKNGRPVINFPIGGYWWLRRDVREMIDWPDNRLSHNGGDTLLAEAVRQQGLPFHKFAEKVKVQILGAGPEGRRGIKERPAGMSGSVPASAFKFDPTKVKIWKGSGA